MVSDLSDCPADYNPTSWGMFLDGMPEETDDVCCPPGASEPVGVPELCLDEATVGTTTTEATEAFEWTTTESPNAIDCCFILRGTNVEGEKNVVAAGACPAEYVVVDAEVDFYDGVTMEPEILEQDLCCDMGVQADEYKGADWGFWRPDSCPGEGITGGPATADDTDTMDAGTGSGQSADAGTGSGKSAVATNTAIGMALVGAALQVAMGI